MKILCTYGGALVATAMLVATPTYANDNNDTMADQAAKQEMLKNVPMASAQKSASGIPFVTGGIGDEELASLKSVSNQYNLHMTSAGKAGEFKGNTTMSIQNKQGEEMVNTNIGPIFYAKLPPGSYTVIAQNQNHEIRKDVTIGEKPVNVDLAW